MANFTQEEIEEINKISVLDYFLYLESKGKLQFERKTGHDYYFRTENNKFSVSNSGYYDFKTGEGGQIIKAVMNLENKSWKDSVEFLKTFANININEIKEKQTKYQKANSEISNQAKVTFVGVPNNEKLIEFFENRGISRTVLKENSNQVHYQFGDKKYFGIGLKNISDGFEIRNSIAKTKIGKSDISITKGTKNEMVVFEGMTDMLSFLQLQKDNNQKNNRTLVTLNSVVNVDKFTNRFKDFDGKIFLCLDGDEAGNFATEKILNDFKDKNIKDVREMYQISENGNNDLNDYLKNKLNISKINANLVEQNTNPNERNISEPNKISNIEKLGITTSRPNTGETFSTSQPEQNRNNDSRQNTRSEYAGNGLASAEWSDLGRTNGNRTLDSRNMEEQRSSDGKKEERENSLGGIVSGGFVSDRTGGRSVTDVEELVRKLTLEKLSGNITNEQVAELVSATCFVSDDFKIKIKDNIEISEEIKDICNSYKSGGISKEGRGILDEYYTDDKIVNAVRNLIKDHLQNKVEISVLEPSVGTGNFLYATKDLALKSVITAFEINETTAKIAKILHPDAEINLRSFETEFIDEKGNKKDEYLLYDLVIGNPPYGEHRGLYKGLGEEPKISKYEDYFVKRSLDSLRDGGILAMVLPSAWLERQKKLQKAEILDAFRLPSGVFKGTQVGTDIIILKKNSQKLNQNISDYFQKNQMHILGETRQKTNRFGKLEDYVFGSLEGASAMLQQLQNNKNKIGIGNLFHQPTETTTEKNSNLTSINSSEKKERDTEEKSIDNKLIDEAKINIKQVIEVFNLKKFKTPAMIKEISKYESFSNILNNNPSSFTNEKLQEILDKSSKIIESHQDKNAEYLVQKTPLIKKGVLKYQFSKNDNIIETGLQNNPKISSAQIEAFKDTDYDGTIKNIGKHAEFANYIDGKWVHDFYYAEGNIYEKLNQLEIDFKDKNAVGGRLNQYEKQKALLINVLPKPKSLDEIFISPNHEFVHQFDLGNVEKDRWNPNTRKTEPVIENYNLAEKFKDFVSTLSSDAFGGSSAWEVRSFVNNDMVTGSDKERNALIRERRKAAANDLFGKFIREELSDDLKERFVKEFNQNYNNIHVPDYSQFPLFSKIYQNFKGEELRLTEVQKAGIGRLTTKGVGLLAHEVGFGKTLSGILAMHEAMERGNAKRPLIAVPNNNILKQWVETIFETIPNAKVNVLGNLGKDYDLSKFDNKDGEITLVTYEGFNNIGFSDSVTQNLASKFSYISENELKSVNSFSERDFQKELQKEKELEGKMKRGKIYDWEDFGFDHLTFDEVHNANHIVGKVKIEDRRFASDFRSQNQQTSKLGINTWMAAQYIQDKYDGRNVTLLSATPFTNKPLEYYSVLSLIANKRLEESGYFNVNTFFETFMEADNDMEIDAKGDVNYKANVRRFKNNSLFQQLLSEFIDLKGEEDNPELVRPNRINKEYKIEQNDLTREQYEMLNDSFSESQKGAILTHILNARLIAISPYLSPFYEGENPSIKEFIENSPKLKLTMDLILQNKLDKPETGQIIYSELAVAEFPKLKEYLIQEIGYKPEEIGIITGATNKNQRIDIQNEFNAGKIKIVIGSEAIQEGMNLQENTTDMYLLSLPYNFTSLRQVEGRAWRQGNKWENVRINFMLTNDSIDVFMLQKLQAKQLRYLEAMKKGANVVDVSDINAHELKTAIITNPETRAKIEIEIFKKQLENEKNKHTSDSAFVLRKYEDFIKVNENLQRTKNRYNEILGYSKDEKDENSKYWKNQLPYFQISIDNAKKEVEKTIKNLAEKGVNVPEIEKQTKNTEEKIKEIDDKIENLPNLQADLIEKYRNEKQEYLKNYSDLDYISERKNENFEFFRLKSIDKGAEKENNSISRFRR